MKIEIDRFSSFIDTAFQNSPDTYEIYKITCLVNGKVYYGQTKVGYLKRFQGHISEAKTKNKTVRLANAIRKYGKEIFKIELIKTTKSKWWCDCLEKVCIGFYNTQNDKYGYNIESGGANASPTLEVRNKISTTLKDGYASGRIIPQPPNLTAEQRMKISNTLKKRYANGELTPPNTGKTFGVEVREKQSNSRFRFFENGGQSWNKGIVYNEEQRRNLKEKYNITRQKNKEEGTYIHWSSYKKAKRNPQSETAKQNISKANMGQPNTPEQIAKISNTMQEKYKDYRNVILDNFHSLKPIVLDDVFYWSIDKATQATGITKKPIWKNLKKIAVRSLINVRYATEEEIKIELNKYNIDPNIFYKKVNE